MIFLHFAHVYHKQDGTVYGACIVGKFQILGVLVDLFLDKKNISSYLGPLVHSLMKIV